MSTLAADFAFEPKVWQDHVDAFFRRKLVFGAFALTDDTLTAAPGETVNFPYFKKIGDAEEPLEDEGLAVDKLQDDAFSATVKEVGKGVGVKMKALRVSAARRERVFSEIQSQIGTVHAEKVDRDLVTEIVTASQEVYTQASPATLMNIKILADMKFGGFGDRGNEASVTFMHSLQYNDLLQDDTAKFLQADANDPAALVAGNVGVLLGMNIIVTDNVPEIAGGIGGKKAYQAITIKPNAYGFMTAENPLIERDKDILHREWVFAGTQWYAVKNFHSKVATDDLRISTAVAATSVDV